METPDGSISLPAAARRPPTDGSELPGVAPVVPLGVRRTSEAEPPGRRLALAVELHEPPPARRPSRTRAESFGAQRFEHCLDVRGAAEHISQPPLEYGFGDQRLVRSEIGGHDSLRVFDSQACQLAHELLGSRPLV